MYILGRKDKSSNNKNDTDETGTSRNNSLD